MFPGTTSVPLSPPHLRQSLSPVTPGGSNAKGKVQGRPNINILENKERIKEMLDKVELSASSYDTAWVAMIPSPSSSQIPLFPQTLNWLLENQDIDGSWGLPNRDESLTKDSLLSTLACVLALKQWGVGEHQTNRGIEYIESKIASALDNDDKQHSPIGFDIIFPHLLDQAQNLDLHLPLGGTRLDTFIQIRESELKRGWGGRNLEGWKAYLAYISEGFGKSQDWEMAMKYQRKNGSLFNSPATTASVFTHLNDAKCFDYLRSLLDKFGDAVPTVHPLDMYARLHMVDSLEKLGISRHFKEEVGRVLDETWRMWQREGEDIILEPTTCAIAFRLLRLHGYNVSSDALDRFSSEDKFMNTLEGYVKDVESVLELHKASHIVSHSNDSVLEELNSWTGHFLKEYLSTSSTNTNHFDHEVPFALRFPHHAYLDFILNRRSIQHYKVDQSRTLKSSYSSLNLANKEFLKLGVEDFNHCQSAFREELNLFNRWFMESGLEKLHFPISKTKAAYSFLTVAATLTSPELREARLTWAMQGLLTCVVDDFYDVWSSEEEQINLIQLMEKWDIDVDKETCSETVKILFLALKSTIIESATQAFKVQGRDVQNHLIQIWLDLLRSQLKEAEWFRSNYVPSIEEYERNGITSMALGPILFPVMYLVGPKLPKAVIESDESNYLFEVVSFYGRYLNDVNGYQREKEQGKFLNSISLRMIHSSGEESEEEIIEKMKRKIEEKRKELLRIVLNEEGSMLTQEVKDVYWKMCRSLHLIYKKEDVIHAKEMPDEVLNIVDIVLSDPIVLNSEITK